jgi:hypothetical protein
MIKQQYNTTNHDEARAICDEVNIPFNRSNHRRITKARQLLGSGMVRKQAEFDMHGHTNIWLVRSQTDETQMYTVMQNGSLQCTCPDHKNGHTCKHSIASILRDEVDHESQMEAEWEARERAENGLEYFNERAHDLAMEAEWEAKMSAQFGNNPNLW